MSTQEKLETAPTAQEVFKRVEQGTQHVLHATNHPTITMQIIVDGEKRTTCYYDINGTIFRMTSHGVVVRPRGKRRLMRRKQNEALATPLTLDAFEELSSDTLGKIKNGVKVCSWH